MPMADRVEELEAELEALKATMKNQLQVTVTARQAVSDVVTQRNAARDASEYWNKRMAEEAARAEHYRAELEELKTKLNTPHITDFIESVRIEAVHQVERWGVDHDAGKTRPDWITLMVYLLGKACKAHFERERDKLLHHIITTAAALMNWHAAEIGADNRMRPGIG